MIKISSVFRVMYRGQGYVPNAVTTEDEFRRTKPCCIEAYESTRRGFTRWLVLFRLCGRSRAESHIDLSLN